MKVAEYFHTVCVYYMETHIHLYSVSQCGHVSQLLRRSLKVCSTIFPFQIVCAHRCTYMYMFIMLASFNVGFNHQHLGLSMLSQRLTPARSHVMMVPVRQANRTFERKDEKTSIRTFENSLWHAVCDKYFSINCCQF